MKCFDSKENTTNNTATNYITSTNHAIAILLKWTSFLRIHQRNASLHQPLFPPLPFLHLQHRAICPVNSIVRNQNLAHSITIL